MNSWVRHHYFMKILIIPDVHQKLHKVEKILENNTFDKLISLGDWFDDFYDTPIQAQKTAEYILDLYCRYGENFVWLLGNHDIPYLFPTVYDYYACSGNTREKVKAIQEVFKGSSKPLGYSVELAHIIKIDGCKDIVLSHAGVSEQHFAKPFSEEITSEDIIERCAQAFKNINLLLRDPVLGAGPARGGRETVGGITWLDWRCEFQPIYSISQIVGHSPVNYPQIVDELFTTILPDESLPSLNRYMLKPSKSYNINIDTHLENYITLENNELLIHKTSALLN